MNSFFLNNLFIVYGFLLLVALSTIMNTGVVFVFVNGADMTWNDDDINVAIKSVSESVASVEMSASRAIQAGEFMLELTMKDWRGKRYTIESSCMSYGGWPWLLKNDLNAIYGEEFVKVNRKGDGSETYNFGYEYHIRPADSFNGTVHSLTLKGVGSDVGCADLLTYGEWSDGRNWDTGNVPGNGDTVTITADSGIIQLDTSVTLEDFTMNGGIVSTGKNSCPDGWAPGVKEQSKCYKGFSQELSWFDGVAYCSSQKGYLARIESEVENNIVRDICTEATEGEKPCWIGLEQTSRDSVDWQWLNEESMLYSNYREWELFEPNNRKHVDMYENCAQILPSYDIALRQYLGTWNDERCNAVFPIVCENVGKSSDVSTLTIEGDFQWNGGLFSGAGEIYSSNTFCTGSQSSNGLMDGVTFINTGEMQISSGVFYGNNFAKLVNSGTISLTSETNFYQTNVLTTSRVSDYLSDPIIENNNVFNVEANVEMNWIFKNSADVTINGGNFAIKNGGFGMYGSFDISDGDTMAFTDGSFAFAAAPVQVFTSSAPREVVGYRIEFDDGSQSSNTTVVDEDDLGHYRLQFQDSITDCIPYHSSSAIIGDLLNNMPSIKAYGGVQVTRSGDGLERWNYGYSYTILFDKASSYGTSVNDDITMQCQGSKSSCGCEDVTAKFRESGGIQFYCPKRNGNTSFVIPNECTILPEFSAYKKHVGSEASITGDGNIDISGGQIYLPTITQTKNLIIQGGFAFATAQTFEIQNLFLSNGTLMLAGHGVEGITVINTFLEPSQRYLRNSSWLLNPPTINGTMQDVIMTGGEMQIFSTFSPVNSKSMYWTGGLLSGKIEFITETNIITTRDKKEVRNGFKLVANQEFNFISSIVHMAEGGSIVNKGIGLISGENNTMWYDADRVGWSAEIDWNENWYQNPLCVGHCLDAPRFVNDVSGYCSIEVGSDFSIDVSLYNDGVFIVTENDTTLELKGGGAMREPYGILETRSGSVTQVNGGIFVCEGGTELIGEGAIEIREGSITLPSLVIPRFKVFGGEIVINYATLIFQKDVTIEGGRVTATYEPTTVIMNGSFVMAGGSWSFREVNPGKEVYPSDLHSDQPTNEYRSAMNILKPMYWTGGEISGNAEINALDGLYIDGGENTLVLSGLAHLVTYGNSVWQTGNIIANKQAILKNKGQFQMGDPKTFMYTMKYETDAFEVGSAYFQDDIIHWETS